MIKKIVGLFIIAAFIGLSVLALTPTPSYALPNFAKKHEASCTLCHTVWPALNRFGEQYLMNGFQMPDTEDGGDVGKIKPDEHVSLDTGSANPPLSVRMVIETTLSTTAADDVELIQANKAETPFFAGGTLGKNLSFFIDNITGADQVGGTVGLPEQMWVGIHNVGGAGTANIRYGVISMADFDARPMHRHDLGGGYSQMAASDATADTVGLQVYGRPGGGVLTYQVSLDNRGSGAGAARLGSNTINPGLLLRGDFGATAVSFHYAGTSDKASFASGAVETKTTSNLISARHVASDFEASLGYGIMSKDVAGAKTDVTGMTLEGIYFTEGYDVQLQFGTLSTKVAGVTTDSSQISLKADYHATTNSKMFVKYVGDSSSTTKDGYISIGTDWAF